MALTAIVSCSKQPDATAEACRMLGDVMRSAPQEPDNKEDNKEFVRRLKPVQAKAQGAIESVRKAADIMVATLQTDDPEQGDMAGMLLACNTAGYPSMSVKEMEALAKRKQVKPCDQAAREVRDAQAGRHEQYGFYAESLEVLIQDRFLINFERTRLYTITTGEDRQGVLVASRKGSKARRAGLRSVIRPSAA